MPDESSGHGEGSRNVFVQESSLQAIANAIRTQNGSADTYTPAEMGPAVAALEGGTPVLRTKTITYNGVFRAVDDGIDGYSSVVVSRDPHLHPHAYDISNGYVDGSTFRSDSSGNYYSDVYKVISGHRYRLNRGTLGASSSWKFYVMFSADDPSQLESGSISGTSVGSSSPVDAWTAPSDGYLTITKTTTSVFGLNTYVFDTTIS